MRVLRVFFVGIFFGMLIRWVLDKIFLEEELRSLADENTILKQRILSLEAPKTYGTGSIPRMESVPLPVEHVQPVAPSDDGPIPPHRDDLKLIKGVGPKIEKQLNEAGVYTFDQMSRLSTEQMQAILGLNKRVVQSADNLISQAKKFAEDGPKG